MERYKIVDLVSPSMALSYGDNAVRLEQMINDGQLMSTRSLAVVRTDTDKIVGGTQWVRDLMIEKQIFTARRLGDVVKEKRWER